MSSASSVPLSNPNVIEDNVRAVDMQYTSQLIDEDMEEEKQPHEFVLDRRSNIHRQEEFNIFTYSSDDEINPTPFQELKR